MILKSVVLTVSSLGGYWYMIISFVQMCTYPHIFQMLVCGSGKPVSSSSDVCISRAEGIEGLLCKVRVAKSGPPAPMIHGAFHFRVGDRYIIRILGQRTIRCRSHISSRLYGRVWNLAVGSMTGSIPGHSPANAFPEKAQAESDTVGCDCQGEYLQNHNSLTKARLGLRLPLFEGLPGVGAALFGVASGATWRAECLSFGARDSAVGEAERGGSFGGDVS